MERVDSNKKRTKRKFNSVSSACVGSLALMAGRAKRVIKLFTEVSTRSGHGEWDRATFLPRVNNQITCCKPSRCTTITGSRFFPFNAHLGFPRSSQCYGEWDRTLEHGFFQQSSQWTTIMGSRIFSNAAHSGTPQSSECYGEWDRTLEHCLFQQSQRWTTIMASRFFSNTAHLGIPWCGLLESISAPHFRLPWCSPFKCMLPAHSVIPWSSECYGEWGRTLEHSFFYLFPSSPHRQKQ